MRIIYVFVDVFYFLFGSLCRCSKIILDSDRSETAIPLESPIQHVTLYSDRSLVERKVTKRLPAGTHIVKFSDISGNIYKDSVQIDVKEARYIVWKKN